MDVEDKVAAMKMGVGVGGATLYSFTLNEWVAICTIVYLVLQMGLLLPKYWRLLKGRDKA